MDRFQSTRRRILVIEDELIVARDLGNLLRRLGHVLIGHASNGPDAIRLTSETKPDLVLMDIRLDGPIDGIQAATEIMRNHKIPVMYVTAYSSVFLDAGPEMVHPFLCVAKPFSEPSVQAAIDSVAL